MNREKPNFHIMLRSSLFYNTTVRHEQRKCDTGDMSATRATQVRQE